MEVIQAKSAGFCFGVARAVKMARELAEAFSSIAGILETLLPGGDSNAG